MASTSATAASTGGGGSGGGVYGDVRPEPALKPLGARADGLHLILNDVKRQGAAELGRLGVQHLSDGLAGGEVLNPAALGVAEDRRA